MAVSRFPEGLVTGTIPAAISGKVVKTPAPASQKEFVVEDIDKLEMYLDAALQDHSIGSKCHHHLLKVIFFCYMYLFSDLNDFL